MFTLLKTRGLNPSFPQQLVTAGTRSAVVLPLIYFDLIEIDQKLGQCYLIDTDFCVCQ